MHSILMQLAVTDPVSPKLTAFENLFKKWGFEIAVIGIILAGTLWALAGHSQNSHAVALGIKGAAVCVGAVVLIGSATALVGMAKAL